MEDILREYEVRLLDGENRLVLIVPVIAGSEDEARVIGAKLAARESASGFALTRQMSSRGYRAQKPAAPHES